MTMPAFRKSTRIFILLSPTPLLITVVVPAIINVALNFSETASFPNILLTRIGLFLSAGLGLYGIYLITRAGQDKFSIVMVGAATLVAGFPVAIFSLAFLVLGR